MFCFIQRDNLFGLLKYADSKPFLEFARLKLNSVEKSPPPSNAKVFKQTAQKRKKKNMGLFCTVRKEKKINTSSSLNLR